MGILGIEHILSALVILHVLHAEPSVQFLRREPQLLGYLRGSVARDGAEHIDGIEGIIEEMLQVVLLLRHHGTGLVEQHLLRSDSRLQFTNLGVQLITAVLADGRQHLSAHPVLERFGLRLIRTHDELVEVELRDEGEVNLMRLFRLAMLVLLCGGDLHLMNPTSFQCRLGTARILDIQCIANIHQAEQRLHKGARHTNVTKLRVTENLYITFHNSTSFKILHRLKSYIV